MYNETIYETNLAYLGVSSEESNESTEQSINTLTTKLKQLPGGHLLPVGTSKYLETGSLFDDQLSEELLSPRSLSPIREAGPEPEQPQGEESVAVDKISALLPGTVKSKIVVGAGGLKTHTKKQNNEMRVGGRRVSANKDAPTKRALFAEIVGGLKPYYFDLRKRHKDSRLFKDYSDIIELGTILHRLRILHGARFYKNTQDIEYNLNSATEWFEAFVLGQFERAYDAHNTEDMKQAATALYRLNGGQTCVQLFTNKNPIFFDEKFNPTLVPSKMPTAPNSGSAYELANEFAAFMDYIIAQCKEQAQIVSQVFVPEMDAMTSFVNKVFEESIAEYMFAIVSASKEKGDIPAYLHALASSIYCFSQFVDILRKNGKVHIRTEHVRKNAVKLLKPFTEKYLQSELEIMQKKFLTEITQWNQKKEKEKKTSNEQEGQANYLVDQEKAIAHKRHVMGVLKSVLFAPVVLTSNLASNTKKLFSGNKQQKASEGKLTDQQKKETPENSYQLDEGSMTSMLSLQLCLNLLNINKDSLGRILVVTYNTDQKKTRSNVEKTFIGSLKIIGEQHLKPAFTLASQRLDTCKPSDDYDHAVNNETLQFFDLVHQADVISQMVDVYFQEDIKPWIDESDFMAEIMIEKKAFERSLDTQVASGMDKAVQVMINQAEYILMKDYQPTDYNPLKNEIDLTPTKMCLNVIKTLKAHTKLLVGATDKNTLDVLYEEVGARLYTTVVKHLKRSIISQTGSMKLICDLNAYYDWACSLRNSSVTKQFTVLKEIGGLYIADGVEELRDIVNDTNKFHGILRLDEILELLASRADHKKIQKYVESKECLLM